MEQLRVTEKHGSNYILYELFGDCNSYTISELQVKLFDSIQETNVVLDLSQVIDVDSSGMGMIMAVFNDALECGKKLYLMNLSPSAHKTVNDTGFMEAFNIIQSVTEVE